MNNTNKPNLNHLRRAFRVSDDFQLSNAEIMELREQFSSIFPYAILFTARSGSTFLTHELQQTKVLSTPEEWFNWGNISAITNEGCGPKDYILKTVKENASPNGVFGMELTWHQLNNLNEIVPIQEIFSHKIKWFFLRRRNIIAQGISHYIAADTGIYHSYQIPGDSDGKKRSVEYNEKEIKRHISDLITQETMASGWMKSQNISPVNLYYEDSISDSLSTSLTFSNVVGATLPVAYLQGKSTNPIKKIATGLNIEFEERFRAEEQEFMDEKLKQRPRVLVDSTII